MRKSIKIIIILFIAFVITVMLTDNVKATEIMEDAKSFLDQGESQRNEGALKNVSSTNTKFEELAGFFWGIGVGVALLTTATMGIKLLMASAGERADLKKEMIPYSIGLVVIFGALTIWKILIQLFESGL